MRNNSSSDLYRHPGGSEGNDYFIPESTWNKYLNFIQNQGSHLILGKTLGNVFEHTLITEETGTTTMDNLEAQACFDVSGLGGSMSACSSVSDETMKTNKYFTSKSTTFIIGGTSGAGGTNNFPVGEQSGTCNVPTTPGSSSKSGCSEGYKISKEWQTKFSSSADNNQGVVGMTFYPFWDFFQEAFLLGYREGFPTKNSPQLDGKTNCESYCGMGDAASKIPSGSACVGAKWTNGESASCTDCSRCQAEGGVPGPGAF